MATARQIEANRRNAQKSTGPRTEAGRCASSLNAYTHGLTSQILVMTPEQTEAYERFIDSLVADLRPVGAMEMQVARSIADTHWRINRAVAIEHNIFASEAWNQENYFTQQGIESDWNDKHRALAIARSFTDRPERFQLLTVYEMRLHRKAQADLRQLRELQATRRAEEKDRAERENAEKEITQTAKAQTPVATAEQDGPREIPRPVSAAPQSSESTGVNAPNGFVFSKPRSDTEIGDFLAAGSVPRANDAMQSPLS